MASKTQARWNGKLVSGSDGEVMTFADSRYSPTPGSNYCWKDAPLLAYLCDPRIGRRFLHEGYDYRPTADYWVLTQVGTSPVTGSSEGIRHDTGATEDNGTNLQNAAAQFTPAANKDIWYGTILTVDEATQTDVLCGLASSDTTLIASAPNSGIYFMKDDGDANIDVVTRASGVETRTDSGIDLVSATSIRLDYHVVGVSRVDFYVNNVLVAQHTTNIPTAIMRASQALLTGEAVAHLATFVSDLFQIR